MILFIVSGFLFNSAQADNHAEDRAKLLALMAEAEAGINAQDINRLTALMTEDVTVIWLNAVVSRNKAEVKDYYDYMVGKKSSTLEKYLTKISLGAPARFSENTALADGKAEDKFFPHSRAPFELDTRWSATLTKESGEWKIASLHLSSNIFTNPLMNEAQSWMWIIGITAVCTGFLLAMIIFMLWYRRKKVI